MVLPVFAVCNPKAEGIIGRPAICCEDFVVILPEGPPKTKGCVGVAHAITRFTFLFRLRA